MTIKKGLQSTCKPSIIIFCLILLFYCCYGYQYLIDRQLAMIIIKLFMAIKLLFSQFYQIFSTFCGTFSLKIGDIRQRSTEMIQAIQSQIATCNLLALVHKLTAYIENTPTKAFLYCMEHIVQYLVTFYLCLYVIPCHITALCDKRYFGESVLDRLMPPPTVCNIFIVSSSKCRF